MDSAIYWGMVRHRRFVPRSHVFQYSLMQWFFALDEIEEIGAISPWLRIKRGIAPFYFRQRDYLRDDFDFNNEQLADAVLRKMNQLSDSPLRGRVFFLGNIRAFGIFFSPLNCYYLQDENGAFTHMLAEVSNTPWNERHYYLVDLKEQASHDKAFHVSPFNPMEMRYHWRLKAPGKQLLVHIEAHREVREFDATMQLRVSALNRKEVFRVLRKHPVMTVKIVAGIYWEALRLFIKRVPFYGHQKSIRKDL
ncbi:MAG: DUF1365 domain-containing protein [Idiomarina sp.]|nr:DUF1365 domain-containing protein [Idiomarina sp.]